MMMMMECAARGRAKTPCAVGSGPPSRRCARCEAVVYCSLSHQISHWKDHKEECGRLEQQMRHSDVLNDFPFTYPIKATSQGFVRLGSLCSFLSSIALHHVGLWKPECHCGQPIPHHEYSRMYAEWNLTSSLCPCSEPREQISTHLTSWKDYYQWRCLPFHSPVALLLHWPLTLFHMVQLASTKKLSSEVRDKLHIHYLGPEKELMQLAVFGELRALFPNLQVHIDFIGPSIPQFRNGEKINIRSYACCSDEACSCRCLSENSGGYISDGKNTALTLQLHRGFYHDHYREILKESFPDIIVAPNAGIAAYSTWSPTIKVIKEMGVPAIFSDFCEEAAVLAAHCISSVTGCPLRIPIQINPFRQPVMSENTSLCVPCYSNCFLFGI